MPGIHPAILFSGSVPDISAPSSPTLNFEVGFIGTPAANTPVNVTPGDFTATRLFAGTVVGSVSNADAATLTLTSTLATAKGKILFGATGSSLDSAYDETNGRLGLGITSPLYSLDVRSSARIGTATNNLILAGNDTNGVGDIHMPDNTTGIRIFGAATLATSPDGAAIQFFGNAAVGFTGQAFIDSGAHNSAGIVFRTAQTSGNITERFRFAADGTPTYPTADGTVGVGAIAGRIKITVAGATKYLRYFPD